MGIANRQVVHLLSLGVQPLKTIHERFAERCMHKACIYPVSVVVEVIRVVFCQKLDGVTLI